MTVCLNCGSDQVSKQLDHSPSDDFNEWWCKYCDLPVDVGERTEYQIGLIKHIYCNRMMKLDEFMEGCGYE